MSDVLTVALIASSASLVVALISLITAIISNRQSSRSAQKIESLRNEFARQLSSEEFLDKHLNESLQSLQAAIEAIQRLKDEIQFVLSATGTSLDSESAIEYIRSVRKQLFECYEHNLANLNDQEASILHQVKNRALSVETTIVSALDQKSQASSITEDDRQRLLEHRNLLTDAQQLLRDSRTNRLIRRAGGVNSNFIG